MSSIVNFDLTKNDSQNLKNQMSQNLSEFCMLNMQLNMSRSLYGNYNISRQQTLLSNAPSVGKFQILKNTAIDDKGDIIVQYPNYRAYQQSINQELDGVVLNNSIPILVQKSVNQNFEEQDKKVFDLKDLNIPMNTSQILSQSKQQFLMDDSIMFQSNQNKQRIYENENQFLQQPQNTSFAFNITQYQNESLMKYSNFNIDKKFLQLTLIDKKMETQSEPEQVVVYQDQDSSTIQQSYEENQQIPNNNNNNNSNQNEDNLSQINIFQFYDNQQFNYPLEQSRDKQYNQFNQQIHSDDEQQVVSKIPNKINKKISKKSKEKSNEQKRISKCRQSRHKNVFKNFGGTLIRFIIYNQYFQDRVRDLFKQDAQKQRLFQDWLQNNMKLERKKDFQIAWTTFKTDQESIKEYKEVLRELSRDFFENFSFIYLMNSRKISDLEIHLRSIHTYLAGINNPDSLERFKPI